MRNLRNQNGQVAVEYLLLMAMLVMLATYVRVQINKQELLSQFVAKPWSNLSGVIENGVIGDPGRTKFKHPNFLYRHASMQGKPL